MDKLLNIAAQAIIRYFTSLFQFGYKKYSSVDKIITFFFIEEMFTGEFSQFITEEDYKTIVDALYCLVGSDCLIDFPMFATQDSLEHPTLTRLTLRVTQDSILRGTQDALLREIV